LFDLANRSALQGVFLQHGLRLAAQHEGMFAGRIVDSTPVPASFQIRQVNDDRTRRDLCAIAERVFAVPPEYARSIYGGEGFWRGSYRAWIGYSNEKPVATAATESAEGTVGLYCVATMPGERRKGFAGAVSAHAIRHAQQAAGVDTAILHSTAQGLPLYRRMGFETVTYHEVFVSA
jgi:ribosomal protein S18 acetylase RimI-like enzyme